MNLWALPLELRVQQVVLQRVPAMRVLPEGIVQQRCCPAAARSR